MEKEKQYTEIRFQIKDDIITSNQQILNAVIIELDFIRNRIENTYCKLDEAEVFFFNNSIDKITTLMNAMKYVIK